MKSDISISDGRSFLINNINGNIDSNKFQGFFFDDVRHLCHFHTYIENQSLEVYHTNQVKYNRAIYASIDNNSPSTKNDLTLIQDKIVSQGLFQSFTFINNCNKEIDIKFIVEVDVDFADIFEIKDRVFGNTPSKSAIERKVEKIIKLTERTILFKYLRETYSRETEIFFSHDFVILNNSLVFNIRLDAHQTIDMSMTLSTKNQKGEILAPTNNLLNIQQRRTPELTTQTYPELQTDWGDLKNLYEKSIFSLSTLKIEQKDIFGENAIYHAAGLPWFMTLFGRDSAITAYQILGYDNSFAVGVLRTLSKYQGTKVDPDNDEEPGKILHEMRSGEFAHFGEWVKFPYYGSIDSTLLYLKLFVGLHRYYGNTIFFSSLKKNILAALKWIDEYGDIDGDGFVEYHRKNESGLRNQNWRDSEDSMLFNSSELAEPPIASADVQGYVYDIKKGLSKIAKDVWKDEELSNKLKLEAETLKVNFNQSFWVKDREFFAMGLDKDKKLIDTPSSMMGHLLWSEIVNNDKSEKVMQWLMSDELYSGWGIRTITKNNARYNPISYHLGSVWPHDNSITARGLFKNGFKKEAFKICKDIIHASKYFNYDLPELFAGYDKQASVFPIPYPTAASPQAWSSGATLQFLKIILGITIDYENEKIILDPCFDDHYSYIILKGFQVFGKRFNIEVKNGSHSIVVAN